MKSLFRGLLAALLLLSIPAFANDVSNGSYSTTDGGNNAAPPNGWPAGMFPNQVEPSARANMGATKRWWERENPALSTTGSAGAYVVTPSNTSYPTAYTQGEVYCAKANFTSVGNDTLNYNGLGAKPIYVPGVSSIGKIVANTILNGAMFCVAFDGVLNSGGGGFQLLSTALPSSSLFLQPSNNLSDVLSATTSRTNLGLGAAAVKGIVGNQSNVATVNGAQPDGHLVRYDNAGNITDSLILSSNVLTASGNLNGITDPPTARGNLGLGNMAQRTMVVSGSGPSGSANDGDLWIQY